MKTADVLSAPTEPPGIVVGHHHAADAPACRQPGFLLLDCRNLPEWLCSAWDALAQDAAEPNPFAERWFVAPGLRWFGGCPEPKVAAVYETGTLLGLVPLHTGERYGRLPFRHVRNWQHSNAFLGTPLVRTGAEKRFWRALIEGLERSPWAQGFLHLEGLVEDGPVHRGLAAAAADLRRESAVVLREERPMMATRLTPEQYLERNVSQKRRAEYRRRRRRLGELGELVTRTLTDEEEIDSWCEAFLQLEQSGWKGQAGSALACTAETRRFFREVVRSAFAAGRLHFLRLDLDGKPIAMLTSLLSAPGAFGFKACFDEGYARFCPGMLLQLDNLALQPPGIEWQDSCATADHPVASLWSEKRVLARVTVQLGGWRRRLSHASARGLERGARAVDRLLCQAPVEPASKEPANEQ